MKLTHAKRKDKPMYTLQCERFPDFRVKFTYNGWWIDRRKLERLIEGFRIDLNNKEACVYAGISEQDLHYFIKIHPEFSNHIRACKSEVGMMAKIAIAEKIEEIAEWYLTHRRSHEYHTSSCYSF